MELSLTSMFTSGSITSIGVAVVSALLIRLLVFLVPFVLRLRHQSRVLSVIPGPQYGFLGMQDDVFNRKDSHAASLRLEQQFGHVWHGRAMWMHVSCIVSQLLCLYGRCELCCILLLFQDHIDIHIVLPCKPEVLRHK